MLPKFVRNSGAAITVAVALAGAALSGCAWSEGDDDVIVWGDVVGHDDAEELGHSDGWYGDPPLKREMFVNDEDYRTYMAAYNRTYYGIPGWWTRLRGDGSGGGGSL